MTRTMRKWSLREKEEEDRKEEDRKEEDEKDKKEEVKFAREEQSDQDKQANHSRVCWLKSDHMITVLSNKHTAYTHTCALLFMSLTRHWHTLREAAAQAQVQGVTSKLDGGKEEKVSQVTP